MKSTPTRTLFALKSARIVICIALLALIALGAFPHISVAQRVIYTIAVNPMAPPVDMHTQWMPLVERLSRETGFEFKLKVYDTMSDFESDIWGDGPDFIFVSPIQIVVAHARHRYAPLVRGEKPVAIRLFVRADSPIKTVDDLSGKKIAFVGNKNLCSVYVRHLLNIQKDTLSYLEEYTGSTKNVIKSVLLGKNDAGSVFVPELEREAEAVRQQMRGILDSSEIAPHPLCAHPRVPEKVQNDVKRIVLAIGRTPEGAELLKTIRLPSPVAADYRRDYKALEQVDVIGLTNWGH
jgi:phosphonate transport system substrate-binding protein